MNHTDLALEAHQQVHTGAGTLPGVRIQQQEENEISITQIKIETDDAARRLEKPIGQYITLELAALLRDPSAAPQQGRAGPGGTTGPATRARAGAGPDRRAGQCRHHAGRHRTPDAAAYFGHPSSAPPSAGPIRPLGRLLRLRPGRPRLPPG